VDGEIEIAMPDTDNVFEQEQEIDALLTRKCSDGLERTWFEFVPFA
jgi:hypothetical protein